MRSIFVEWNIIRAVETCIRNAEMESVVEKDFSWTDSENWVYLRFPSCTQWVEDACILQLRFVSMLWAFALCVVVVWKLHRRVWTQGVFPRTAGCASALPFFGTLLLLAHTIRGLMCHPGLLQVFFPPDAALFERTCEFLSLAFLFFWHFTATICDSLVQVAEH